MFRFKLTLLIALIIVISIILISIYLLRNTNITENETINLENNNPEKIKYSLENLNKTLKIGIDSVLFNFGIKEEWIETIPADSLKKPTKQLKREIIKFFVKNIIIPKDLTTIEVNADLSSFFNTMNLNTIVKEDIITKNIKIYVSLNDSNYNNSINKTDSLIEKEYLAIININSSDKISRQSAFICIIISNITDFNVEDIDKYFINKNEFSFVFPRNLDEIDLQNKLLHIKKDIIINMTVGNKENYVADFNPTLSEKQIREKVRSFTIDYPSINTVLLSKIDDDLPPQFISVISDAFSNYKVKVIKPSDLILLIPQLEEKNKDKFLKLEENIIKKGQDTKFIITTLSINKNEVEDFYDRILTLKKLGYKFYNYNECLIKKGQFEKKEAEKIEKLKEEKLLQDKKQKEIKQKEIKQKRK